MQKIILFSSVLALLGLCACSSNTYTLEQLAKAQEIAKDISPDIYEQYKGTPAEYVTKRFYEFSVARWTVREPEIRSKFLNTAVLRLADFYDQLHKADNWTFKPERVIVPSLKKTPVIDGKVNDGEWSRAASFCGEYILDMQIPDADNAVTRWFIGISGEAFYVALDCQDPDIIPLSGMNEVFSGKAKNPIYEGDGLEFFIRPDRAKRSYVEIQVNADGLIWPLRHKVDPHGGWQVTDSKIKQHGIVAKTSRTPNGYQLEMQIPFSLLGEKNLKNFSFMLLRTHRDKSGKMWSSAICPLLYNAHNVFGFIPAAVENL